MPVAPGGCTYSYLWTLSLDDTVNRLADLGFRSIELMATPPHLWPAEFARPERAALRRLCASRGITITSVNPTYLDLNLASLNPGFRAETVRQLREMIRLAHDLEAEAVVVVAGRKHPLLAPEPSHLWRLVREGLETLLPDCDRLGVTLALENGWTVIDRVEQLWQMCQECAHPRLGVTYDVANALAVESPTSGLHQIAAHLALLHLSDTQAGRWGHDRIGSGMVDFTAVTQAVRQIGYTGRTILEIVDPASPDEANRTSLERLWALGWSK